MLKKVRCLNFNHSRTNVTVRFCSMCSEVVNDKIPTQVCEEKIHARKRRMRTKYCTDCGEQLIQAK